MSVSAVGCPPARLNSWSRSRHSRFKRHHGLRDAAQHHIVELSGGHLYIQAQTGITLHRDLLKSMFNEDLRDYLPERVLPIATIAPLDPISLFAEEIEEVARLLSPGRRQGAVAHARLRSLAIVDRAMQGERLQPSDADLSKLGVKIRGGRTTIEEIFPGIAAIAFTTEGSGTNVNLRIVKNEGMPVSYVQSVTTAGQRRPLTGGLQARQRPRIVVVIPGSPCLLRPQFIPRSRPCRGADAFQNLEEYPPERGGDVDALVQDDEVDVALLGFVGQVDDVLEGWAQAGDFGDDQLIVGSVRA